MKPIDLYDAMEGIPDQYIEAAKPAVKRKGESHAVTAQTAHAAEQEHSRPRTQKRQNRKDSIHMSTIQPVWQRITTGFVAAAACAVFVGGGWFIVKQAKQNQQDYDDSTTKSAPNFLGGLGQVHAASDMYLMYDNEKAYFYKAQFEAKRTGGEVGTLVTREYAADIFWDGEQFYRAEDNALYRIGMDGKHLDSKPFFTVNTDEIQKQVSTDIVDIIFLDTKKLAEGSYYISFAIGTATDKTVNWDNKVFGCIYEPANGHQSFIPNDSISEQHLVTNGNDIIAVNSDNTMYRVTLNPVGINEIGKADTYWYYYTNRMLANGSMYFMASKSDDECETVSYGKIDLSTLEYTDILETPEFTNFVPYGGKIYALYSDGSKLICADPDMKNVETVCDFNGMLTEKQQAAIAEDMAEHSYAPELNAVDDNWFMISLSWHDAARGKALIDRKTMKAQLFTEKGRADSTEQAAAPNILGGTGALHANGDTWVLYDDSNVYFEYAALRGERNPAAQLAKAVSGWNPASDGKERNRLDSDGKYMYMTKPEDTFSIYRLNSIGQPEAQPFFTVRDEDIEAFRSGHNGQAYLEAFSIDRLTEQYYHVFFSLTDDSNGSGATESRNYRYLFNTETRECRDIPSFGEQSGAFRCVQAGDYFYCRPDNVYGFCRFRLPEYEYETFLLENYIWNDSLLIHDNAVYYLSLGKSDDFADPCYSKYDLNTQTVTVLTETPEFRQMISYDGMIYAATKSGSQIICTDPELKNKTVLIDLEQDVPSEIKAAINAVIAQNGDSTPMSRLDGVDENYISAELRDGSFVMLDRKTNQLRFYRRTDSENTEQNAVTALTTAAESAAATTTTAAVTGDEENVFGGWGKLYPVDWDNHGAVALYRDSNNYYFFDGTEEKWYRSPLAGGEKEPLPARINGAQAPHEPFISDGERVYTKDMIVLSEGNAANAFDTAQIRAYLNELNDDATDNGYYYNCQNIWHIRNRYFLHVTGTNQNGNIISIEVWTDEAGRIISHENAPANISLYFCNSKKTEMRAIKDQYLDVRDCPGDAIDEKPDPLAYGKIIDMYSDMENQYYFTADRNLYTRVQGEPVLVTNRAFSNPKMEIAPDGRFFYVNMDPLNFSVREWIGGSQDNELYAPELCQELRICGFEETGNGTYNLVLARTVDTDTGYVFVDAATGQAVKKIQ